MQLIPCKESTCFITRITCAEKVGLAVGVFDGILVGTSVGVSVGVSVGAFVLLGDVDGLEVGENDGDGVQSSLL